MKNKSIYKLFIVFVITILLVYLLSYLLGFEIHNNLVALLALSVILFILVLLIINIFKKLKNIKDYYSGTIIILCLINACIFMLGVLIFFIGIPITKNYSTIPVKVVSSTWNTVTIDYTEYNHDDEKIITIRKPFCVSLNDGDIISVRYDKVPTNMYYVADFDIGSKLISVSIRIFEILGLVIISLMIIKLIKHKRGKG